MTKNQCKNKITRLEGKIGEMQEQVIHFRTQVKLLDAEDSKKLLERYHIESEELAELIMQRVKTKADKSKTVKPGKEEKAIPKTEQQDPTGQVQTEGQAQSTEKPRSAQHSQMTQQAQEADRLKETGQLQMTEQIQAAEEPQPAEITGTTEPQNKVNPLDMFR